MQFQCHDMLGCMCRKSIFVCMHAMVPSDGLQKQSDALNTNYVSYRHFLFYFLSMSIVYLSSFLLLSLWCVNRNDFSYFAQKIRSLRNNRLANGSDEKWKCSAPSYIVCIQCALYNFRHVHCVHVENQFLFLLMGKRCWNLAETIRRKMNHIKWFLRSLLQLAEFHFLACLSRSLALFGFSLYVWKRTMKHMLLHEQNTFFQTPVIKQIRHNREQTEAHYIHTKRIEIGRWRTFLFLSVE